MPEATRIATADVLAIDAAVARSTGGIDFGITKDAFVPKPFARLLAEKLALARALLGEDLDLGSGSVIRKLLEISALEDHRTWVALLAAYDNSFAVSATGDALSRIGQELGLPRPFLEARGRVKLSLQGSLPTGSTELTIPRGARMLSSGGHHASTDETVALSPEVAEREVAVVAFYPGPEHNLDPAFADATGNPQKLDCWNEHDHTLREFFEAKEDSPGLDVAIQHTTALTGGGLQWPDDRYRTLLLRAPRSIWTVDAIEVAVSLVPGVRQVQVHDAWGGLDIHQSIFGNFNFVERVFGSERDLGTPYYVTILVAPTRAAIWEGPDGLRASVEQAIEDLRPISIFPLVQEADQIGIGIAADLVVRGLPLPSGSRATVNESEPAKQLKLRLLSRVRQYVDALGFGEPVRASEVIWALMNEPGVADVRNPRLLRYPPGFDAVDFGASGLAPGAGSGTNEVQRVAIAGAPTGGTFRLRFAGGQTSAIPHNAPSLQVQAALTALAEIGAGNLTASGGPLPGAAVQVTFTGALGARNVAQITAVSALTGGTSSAVTVSTITEGVPGLQEFDCGANVELQANQIPVFVEDETGLVIV